MAINRNTIVTGRNVPDLTLEQFQAILEAASSPALVEAQTCYEAICDSQTSVAFILSIFMVESGLGTAGLAVSNRSPGNTRSVMPGNLGQPVQTTKGTFIRYPTWLAGFRDLVDRLSRADYIYARQGLTTIAGIIPVFSPSEDGNNVESYISKVVLLMSKWVGSSNTMEIIDLSDNTPSSVYTNRGMEITELILHDTAGKSDSNSATESAAQAALNATIRWFQGNGGVSIHYLIGPERLGAPIYRLCKEQFAAYHAVGNKGSVNGVSKDNRISIGIERFGQPGDSVGPNQRAAMLWLVVDICNRNGLDPSQIISHASIQSDRTDGKVLLQAARDAVKNGGISHVTNETPSTRPVALPYGVVVDPAGALIFPGNIPLNFGFKTAFLTLFGNVEQGELSGAILRGVKIFGLPVAPEVANDTGSTQDFELATFRYNKNEAEGWEIRLYRDKKAA